MIYKLGPYRPQYLKINSQELGGDRKPFSWLSSQLKIKIKYFAPAVDWIRFDYLMSLDPGPHYK